MLISPRQAQETISTTVVVYTTDISLGPQNLK